jgi:hypothetical protein
MATFVATPQLVDTLDSYYQYVKNRVLQVNPDRVFGGIAQARDWPMKEALLDTPYLLDLSDTAVPFGKSVSNYQPSILYRVQWAWLVQGDNIQQNTQAANRGDKYRINMKMKQEIITGHYPGFCEKMQYFVTDDGSGNPVLSFMEYNPPEFIRFSQPRFSDKQDQNSGILFCSGAVSVSAFAPAITQ